MSDNVELLKRVYDLFFNNRDIERVSLPCTPDVIWTNGMEGGHVHGRDEVRLHSAATHRSSYFPFWDSVSAVGLDWAVWRYWLQCGQPH
jgi:hypothetical protein